jgi:hypothetical protein
MPALHAKAPPLFVANARHSPGYGCALRLDRVGFDAPFGHARKIHKLCAVLRFKTAAGGWVVGMLQCNKLKTPAEF